MIHDPEREVKELGDGFLSKFIRWGCDNGLECLEWNGRVVCVYQWVGEYNNNKVRHPFVSCSVVA